jgi:hypothetical protein
MKLYTEEELLKAMSYSRSYDANWVMTENEILKLITPIELPSDEEIAYKLKEVIGNIGELEHRKLTFIGALWMKEQILNQNK